MAANEKMLVIVESPAKSKTIKKILGNNYTIEASYGHIRDLPKKDLGFDIENDFRPSFEVIPEKKKVVEGLNKLAKKMDRIYLASDPDREGEAIAWHVRQVLKVPDDKIRRITFNEITPNAVKSALESPRDINMNLVLAQQTRQILDKLVGFKISPILWEKLRNYRLSAGRVQSVALRLICEREDEIEAFTPAEYWTIEALLSKDGVQFETELARLKKDDNKDVKIEIKNKEQADKILKDLKGATYKVAKINSRDTQRKPQAPFITSTLQREASSKLGYGVSKTMQVAQKLYEGIDLGEEGSVGLITYMRTDSTRISDDAQKAAKDFIEYNYGNNYYPKTPNIYAKKGKNVQDAHEAIRPSYIERTPESIKKYLTAEQYKLYKLIWSRFMASQMSNAKIENMTVDIEAGDYIFKTGSSKVIFEGFLKVYTEEDEDKKEQKLGDLKIGDVLDFEKLIPEQHFTQPPARFSEASLVKTLEEYGIGRPSTYAPIIVKIQQRGYVEKIDKSLKPTILGRTICTQLVEHFKEIMNYEFTASMELKLDDIAEDKADPSKVLHDFYLPFEKVLNEAKENMGKVIIESEVKCPNCGATMVVKTSRFGKQFLACPNYPECKTAMPLNGEAKEPTPDIECDEKCEKCGSDMVIKTGPYGKYYQCKNEACKARKKIVISSGVKCPKCEKEGRDGELIERKSRYGKLFWGCSKYPDCNFVVWSKPTGEKCPECQSLLVEKHLKKGDFIACSNKDCKYTKPMEDK